MKVTTQKPLSPNLALDMLQLDTLFLHKMFLWKYLCSGASLGSRFRSSAIEDVVENLTIFTFFINPIPPRLFSNLFPLGGGRHVSHPVEMCTEIFLHQNFSLRGPRVSLADFGFKGPWFDSQ